MTLSLFARAAVLYVTAQIACCGTIPAYDVSHIAGLTAEIPSGTFAQGAFAAEGIAYAKDGSIWLVANEGTTILRVDNAGELAIIAGTPGRAGFADGKGPAASFNFAHGLAVTPSNTVAIADTWNNCIRVIDTAGNVTTVRDRSGHPVHAEHPYHVAVDPSGNIFIPDGYDVVKVSSAGDVSIFAGIPGTPGTADGQGNSARLGQLTGITSDASGNVYVAELYQYTVRKITPDGTVTTLAGMPLQPGHVDGVGSAARFVNPYYLAADRAGSVYLGDANSFCIRKIDSLGTVTTIAGSPAAGGYVNGTGSSAQFVALGAMTVDNAGNVVVSDGGTIRRITPSGNVSTIAGTYRTNDSSQRDGTGPTAVFAGADGIAIDAHGNLFIADTSDFIRKVTPEGVTTTVAGSGRLAGHDDGPALSATFNAPTDVAFTPQGDLVIADTLNHAIRKLSTSGNVTTVAGGALQRGSSDGVGTAARFNFPTGVAVDAAGMIYVADSGNHVVRKISLDGTVSTVVGRAGVAGYVNGPKSVALLNHPLRLAFGPDGALYIADDGNAIVRKLSPDGNVTSVGNFLQSGARGVAVDAKGYVYCADTDLYRDENSISLGSAYSIAVVEPDGTTSHSIGVQGVPGNSDGIGAEACLGAVSGVAVNAAGVVYFTDGQSVRKATPVPPPVIVTQPTAPIIRPGAKVSMAVRATGLRLTYQWLRNGQPLSGETSPTLTFAALSADDGAVYSVVVSDPSGQVTSNATVLSVSPNNPASGRLVNIAARSYCGMGDEVAIGGFVIAGATPRKVLVRAVGPTLRSAGLPASEVLADPTLEIHDAKQVIARNDDWRLASNADEIISTALAVGAAALADDDNKSSAVLMNFMPGVYSFVVSPKTGSPGVVLLEAYDVEPDAVDPCFINIATRAKSAAGNGVTIGGFVVEGGTPKKVLIRAVGPTLATLGLSSTSVLQNPSIELHDASHGNAVIYRNDDYGSDANAAEIAATTARIGATAIAGSDTTSSALLVTLPAGAYSFIANGSVGAAGIVLVEVYDAD
jgi:sugar lactone lactonase YvrE